MELKNGNVKKKTNTMAGRWVGEGAKHATKIILEYVGFGSGES